MGRPAVISPELADRLDAYRRFRHRARHIYGFDLEWSKVQGLAAGLLSLFEALQQGLSSFGMWLQARVKAEDE